MSKSLRTLVELPNIEIRDSSINRKIEYSPSFTASKMPILSSVIQRSKHIGLRNFQY